MKQVVSIVEKKVRNLEKRKGKLDQYRQKDNEGQALNRDQKEAIEKYDSVITCLEFARDLQKQYVAMANEFEKLQRKQLKRDKLEKHSNDLKRVQEILQLQGLLDNMGSDSAREDFKEGTNGAIKLSEENLEQLDVLYKLVSPSMEGESSYESQLTAASEHLVNLLDARDRELNGTTYKALNELIEKINNCNYFDSTSKKEEQEPLEDEKKDSIEEAPIEDKIENVEQEDGSTLQVPEHTVQPNIDEPLTKNTENPVAIPGPAASVGLSAQNHDNLAQSLPAEQDDSFFTTPSYNGQRAFTEIVSSVQGPFDFLQDSHIESQAPHIDPAVVAVQPMSMPAMSQQSLGMEFGQNSRNNFTSDQSQTPSHIDQSVTGIPSQDIPPSIPLTNQTTIESQTQATNQEKKHFMNPNAVTFHSMYQTQSSTSVQQSDNYQQQMPRNSTTAHTDSNYENEDEFQGNSNFGSNFRGRGNSRNTGRGGRGGQGSGMSNGYTQRGVRSNSYNGRGFGSNNRGSNRGSYQGYPPRSDYQPDGYQGYNNGTSNYGKRTNSRGSAGMRGGHRGAGGTRGRGMYNSGGSRAATASQ